MHLKIYTKVGKDSDYKERKKKFKINKLIFINKKKYILFLIRSMTISRDHYQYANLLYFCNVHTIQWLIDLLTLSESNM